MSTRGVQCRGEPAPLFVFNLVRPEGDAKRQLVPQRRYRRTKKGRRR